MHPKPETIAKFRQIYHDDFGEELTVEEATRMWLDLMDFMILLFKKTPEEMGQSSTVNGSVKMERTS